MRIIFAATTAPRYDQRMIRICNSLAKSGYRVTLIGAGFLRADRAAPDQPPRKQAYGQKTLTLLFRKGLLFYAEYNLRLFLHLLFSRADILCSIDLDTILPVYLISRLKRIGRVHDAHEYFSQMKEVVTRPAIYRFWHRLEKNLLPKFPLGYTVSEGIAREFEQRYGIRYTIIRNVPQRHPPALKGDPILPNPIALPPGDFFLYQGSVNEARGFEYLIPAMRQVKNPLVIIGEGNFLLQAKQLAFENRVLDRIVFIDRLLPSELRQITGKAVAGINLVEPIGLSQIYSLANKFFDYIHAGIPQVTMNFPEYKKLNDQYSVAVLIDELSETAIASAMNTLLDDRNLYRQMKENCARAAANLNWEAEEVVLLNFYEQLPARKNGRSFRKT